MVSDREVRSEKDETSGGDGEREMEETSLCLDCGSHQPIGFRRNNEVTAFNSKEGRTSACQMH